jgi:hypothetical protein
MKTNYWFNRNRLLSGLCVVTALLLVPSVLFISASSSQAEAAQTYHGTLTGGTFLCDGTPVNGPIVTGTWNVNIDPQTPAQVTLNVFYNGGHHLAFGYNALMQVSFVNGVYVFSGFGDAATATLDTTANPVTFSTSSDPAHGGRSVVSAHLRQQSTESWPMSAEGRLTVVVISVKVVGEAASLPYNHVSQFRGARVSNP